MERRVRIIVTLGLISALMGLMLINVEPEVDLSVDQLMDTPRIETVLFSVAIDGSEAPE